MQGWRKSQEDAHIHELDVGDGNQLYAIFDGHGGENVSKFCEEYFTSILVNMKSYQSKNYELALQEAFVEIDYLLVSNEGHKLMRQICSNNQPMKEIAFNEGCTACVVLITNDSIYCANAGDSRAVIGTKNGEVIELSQDNKPDNAEEKRRIQASGNNVSMGRVNGSLAVSRAIGDWEFKNDSLLAKLQA
jgi:serine/threonine protein phosphatase PrpC